MQKAEYWHKTESGAVQCDLCPHACVIAEGKTGRCRVRGVKDGILLALQYGNLSSAHLDPIEKKPLYHFYPGSEIFSIGGWGCNFGCVFCQNWSISQQVMEGGLTLTPEAVVRKAEESGAGSIAYTYNEPLIGFEFVRDVAVRAKEKRLHNVLVTNGFVQKEPGQEILALTDALNVDIKSMEPDFYRTHCKGQLEPVLAFAAQARAAGCHLEITNLLIPGLNDQDDNVLRLAEWIRENLGAETPLHLSAYHPQYKMEVAPTPAASLLRAHAICRESLSYVYLGNVATETGRDTECPACSAVWIRRGGYRTKVVGLKDDACAACGRRADIFRL